MARDVPEKTKRKWRSHRPILRNHLIRGVVDPGNTGHKAGIHMDRLSLHHRE